MKQITDFITTGVCTIYNGCGHEIVEAFGMDRRTNPKDLRRMIFACFDSLTEFEGTECVYRVSVYDFGNEGRKTVLEISVSENEFFDDMYEVRIDGKSFGWIDVLGKSHPHLSIY